MIILYLGPMRITPDDLGRIRDDVFIDPREAKLE